MLSRNILYISIFCSVLFANPEIILKDGSILKGTIVSETDSIVVFKTKFGEQSIPTIAIKEIIRQKQQVIHLKDGSVINGRVISTSMGVSKVETAFGVQSIPEDQISRIDYERNQQEHSNVPSLASKAFEDIGTSMLYNSQKKSITTALGFQMLGGGLLYAEKKTAGTIMLLAETGLLLAPIWFGADDDISFALFLSGMGLKTINTIWTISAINEFNRSLRIELGIESKDITTTSPRQSRFMIGVGSADLKVLSLDVTESNRIYLPQIGYRFGEGKWLVAALIGDFVTYGDSQKETPTVESYYTMELFGSIRVHPKNSAFYYSFGCGVGSTHEIIGTSIVPDRPGMAIYKWADHRSVSTVAAIETGWSLKFGLFYFNPSVSLNLRGGKITPYTIAPTLDVKLGLIL